MQSNREDGFVGRTVKQTWDEALLWQHLVRWPLRSSNKSLPHNLLDLSALVGAALDEVCTFKNWISCEKLHQWWVRNPPKLDCSCWSTHLTFWILQSDGHNIWWSVLALMIVVSRFRICDIDLLTNTIPYVIWVQVLKVSLSSRVHPLFLKLTAFFPSSLSSEVWILRLVFTLKHVGWLWDKI